MIDLRPLRNRAFRFVFLARASSSIGDAMITIALAFAVLHVGGSATQLGLIMGLGLAVRTVLLLVGGVWADRLPRQLVMLAMDVVRAGVEAVVAVLLITGHATLWQLTLGTVAHNAASAFFNPASDGLTPQLLGKEQVQSGVALLDLTRSVPGIAGPVLSGILVSAVGTGWVFAIDAASFAGSALCLAVVKLPPLQPKPRQRFLAEVGVGFREIAARAWYWQNLITHALWNFAMPFFWVLGPVVAAQSLGGAHAWGIVAGATGVGAVFGGLVALRWKPHRPLVVGNLLLLLSAVPLVLLAREANAWAIACALAPAMAGLTMLNAFWWSVVATRLSEDVLGRVASVDWVISTVINPAGLAIAGPIAAAVGTPTALYVAAGVIAVPSFLVTLLPSVRGVVATPSPPPSASGSERGSPDQEPLAQLP